MNKKLDVVLINPGDRKQIYQDLGKDYAAVEPPYWIAALAAYLRNGGFGIEIIDSNADNLSPKETAAKVDQLQPLLAAIIVYGSQPSASTQNMTIAGQICQTIKEGTSVSVAIGGLHPSALPRLTLEEEKVDFVIAGEGFHTLTCLIQVLRTNSKNYSKIPGLWYREGNMIHNNPKAALVQNLDEFLPVAAWDLLPMQKYRAHNWHCFDDIKKRMPYGAIYTSMGCPYSCIFCCINAPFGKPGIRYRSPQVIMKDIDLLVNQYGVKNIKIIDELFVLSEKHYMTITDMLLKRGYDLNIWAYARVDTVKPENLEKMKKAGMNWLALGIESASPEVRDGAEKKMKEKDIKRVIDRIHSAGIRIIGNYIFGLPEDTLETMQQNLDMAIDLNCEFVNFYCAMAYPGSKLYEMAVKEKWELPRKWHFFSQHAYEMLPLPTKHIGAKEVLRFRDEAFHEYNQNPRYLSMLEERFGAEVKEHVREMTKTRLRRKLLEGGSVGNSE